MLIASTAKSANDLREQLVTMYRLRAERLGQSGLCTSKKKSGAEANSALQYRTKKALYEQLVEELCNLDLPMIAGKLIASAGE